MKKIMLIIVSLLSLIACSQKPAMTSEVIIPTAAFTPWVAGTQTALAGPTSMPSAETVPALPTFPFPSVTPYVEKPTDFSPVLYGKKYDAHTFFLLLGGASKETWLAPDKSVSRFNGEATYSLHTFNIANQYYFWGKSPELQFSCKSYLIGTDIDVNEKGMVATMDGWGITKQPVVELSADLPLYQQAVTDWLVTQGVSNPQIGELHIFQTDLEGDGATEIFISATHLDESQHTTQAGDYSIVLLRKLIGNEVVTIPLVADFYNTAQVEITFPRTYSIGNLIDLNQDGVMEVVVDIQRWEGFGAIVYQVNGQTVTEVLRAEC